jgi:acetyl-CoA C-acetyltransferase
MQDVVIVSAVRTAIGSFGGSLKTVPSVDLGAIVIKDLLKRVKLRPVKSALMREITPEKLKNRGLVEMEKKFYDWDDNFAPVEIDEVIMGTVLQAAQGQNPARQAMIYAGLPKETPAFIINKMCGSGLKTVALGAASIMAGEADVVVAGGQESMSNAPMAMPKARWGHRLEISGFGEMLDLLVFDGFYEVFYGYHMGVTAENIVSLYNIGRQEQDELAVMSHQRARRAIADGLFSEEIVPVQIKACREETVFDTDERPMDTNMEKMSKLKPVFKKDGTITAGNASGINDGAAVVLLMSAQRAKDMGIEPMAKIKGFASAALDPAYMGLGPVAAIRKVLKKTGMSIRDFDTIEINEAFAAQIIGCMMELGIEYEKPNELGSGISLGHPIGCTGARQLVTTIYNMKHRGYNTGLVSMCIGGGMGMAMVIERP